MWTRAVAGRLQRSALRGGLRSAAAASSSEPVHLPDEIGSRVSNLDFSIIDSTLREGEQFDSCAFSTQDRIYIAKCLDKLGVDYIEMLNPIASTQAFEDCRVLRELGLPKAKLLTHIRCDMRDVEAAINAGVQGVNMYMATSKVLAQHSHGKGIDEVVRIAEKAIKVVLEAGLECRFSCEDTFRSEMDDVLRVYSAVAETGLHRIGVADTVGVATPWQAYRVVSTVRKAIPSHVGIEFHAHNDTGCALANSLMAIEAGATHIDTCVLGIGERNGIVPLGSLLARMYTVNREETMKRFRLQYVNSLDKYVAAASSVSLPFNNCVTGSGAFTHKAGVHTKAVMSNPAAYEVIDPNDFGVVRRVNISNRITGWNAVKARANELSLKVTDEQIQVATTMIKNLADEKKLTADEVDSVLMSIATGPCVSSSEFVQWGGGGEESTKPELREAAEAAAQAIRLYQEQLARAAIAKLKVDSADSRPFRMVRLTGHLFDREVLNKAMDICVDSKCDFDLVRVQCAPKNNMQSAAEIRLTSAKKEDIDKTVGLLESLVNGSNCGITDITAGNPDDVVSETEHAGGNGVRVASA